MKKFFALVAFVFGLAESASALTYEEAFDTIKEIPQMKGVESISVNSQYDFASLGISDGQLTMWNGEKAMQTEVYGNVFYKVMGELPAADLIKGSLGQQAAFVIFAHPIGEAMNQILILSDSPADGFTGAILGKISDDGLEAFKKCILVPTCTGGTAVYMNVLNF